MYAIIGCDKCECNIEPAMLGMKFAHQPLCMPENTMRNRVIDQCRKHKQAYLGDSRGVSLAQGGRQLSAVVSYRPASPDLIQVSIRSMKLLHSIAIV